jgi:Holliday junction DNA helicase RuvB
MNKTHPTKEIQPEDTVFRPKSFEEYIGQSTIVSNLKISMEASVHRNQPIEHVLLFGPPGLGKTSLASVIANELKSNIIRTTATSIKRIIDLFSIVMSLDAMDILFIDEVHRLDKRVEEALYSVMEDYSIQIVRGSGKNIKAMTIPCNPFTLIGATTRAGLLSKPFRDRFGHSFAFEYYHIDELITVIRRLAPKLDIQIGEIEAEEIAKRSRGTPRIAIHLLKRVSDFSIVKKQKAITMKILQDAFNTLKIDQIGLSELDRKYLKILFLKSGRPIGIDTICAILSDDRTTLEEVTEPYLLSINFIEKTNRGRVITREGLHYLKENQMMAESEELLF